MPSTDAILHSSRRFRRFDNPRTFALSRIIRYYISMARVISLKTPKNTDELKELYKQNQLVYYTPIEELINSSSHALGAVFALIFMIFMMIAAKSPAQYVTAFFSCFLIAVEFLVSATYHGVSNMKKKLVWRKIDFPAVNLNSLPAQRPRAFYIAKYTATSRSECRLPSQSPSLRSAFGSSTSSATCPSSRLSSSARLCLRHSSRRTSLRSAYPRPLASCFLQGLCPAFSARQCSACTKDTYIASSTSSCLQVRCCFWWQPIFKSLANKHFIVG